MRYLFLIFSFVLLGETLAQYQELYYGFKKGEEFKKIDGWVVQKNYTEQLFYTCGRKNQIVGGSLAFGKGTTMTRTFKVPPHYKIQLKLNLYKIGQWFNDRMIIFVDDYQWESTWGGATALKDCAYGNTVYEINIEIAHTAPTVTILFTSTNSQQPLKASYGVQEIKVNYIPCPVECGVCSGPDASTCSMFVPVHWAWFDKQRSGDWKVSGGSNVLSSCSGIQVWGGMRTWGQGTELEKIVDVLPPHYKLRIQYQFWKIDSWNNEIAQLYVDRTQVWKQNFVFSEGADLCELPTAGTKQPEKVLNVDVEPNHNINSALFKLNTTLSQTNQVENFGIRAFVLYTGVCAQGCFACSGPAPTQCSKCIQGYTLQAGVCVDPATYITHETNFDNGQGVQNGWSVSGALKPDLVFNCGSNKLLGGKGVFAKDAKVEKTFQLPSHSKVRIQLEVWKISGWNGEEVVIEVDGKVAWRRGYGWSDPGTSNICNIPDTIWYQKTDNVTIVLPHKSEKLSVKVYSTLNADSDSESNWGIRNFVLSYEAKPECAYLYTECYYKGQEYMFCEQEPNFQLVNLPREIKSVKVPSNSQLILWDETDYQGEQVKFTQSVECIAPKQAVALTQGVLQNEISSKKVKLDKKIHQK